MKPRHSSRLQIASVIAFLMVSCDVFVSAEKDANWERDKTYYLTVLHTNDHHGHFWQNKYGEYGMAARKTLIDSIRAEAKFKDAAVLLLSGGDINTGVPESDLQNAEPDFKGMALIGYDAMALGNHEFDNPLSVLEKQMQWAKFPMLSANIYDKKTGKRKFQPFEIFKKNGLNIAVIGLTTQDTAKIGNPEYISSLEFRDPKAEAKALLAEVKKKYRPDITIAVTHMGHYENGQHGINASGDVALARFLNKGSLNMIIGGHSQEPVCMEKANVVKRNYSPGTPCLPDQQNGVWVMQAHEWGKYVGKAEFTFKNGKLDLVSYELIPVNLKKKININGEVQRVFVQTQIPHNAPLYNFLKTYQDKGGEQLNIRIASVNGKLEGDRDKVRFEQTNLGRLIAAAHMERAKADFAIMNSGGVRASIEDGEVTYKDVLAVQPFGNMITYVDMTGQEVLDYLDVVATKPVDSGAYAQFYGISMRVEKNKVTKVVIGDHPLDLQKLYRFTVPSFNAAGGDGYPNIVAHNGYVNTGFVDAEVLKEFLEKHSPLNVQKFNSKDEVTYVIN